MTEITVGAVPLNDTLWLVLDGDSSSGTSVAVLRDVAMSWDLEAAARFYRARVWGATRHESLAWARVQLLDRQRHTGVPAGELYPSGRGQMIGRMRRYPELIAISAGVSLAAFTAGLAAGGWYVLAGTVAAVGVAGGVARYVATR